MNPGKVFICARNMADEGTLIASASWVESCPLSNLQRSSRPRIWQTIDASPLTLRLSWPDLTERINFVSLWRHNFMPAATWNVSGYLSTDASDSPPLFSTGSVYAWDAPTLGDLDFGVEPLADTLSAFGGQRYALAYFLENDLGPGSIEIDIDDSTNTDGFLRASRLYVGRGIELTLGAASASLGWSVNSQQFRGDGGSLRTDGSTVWRELELDVLIDQSQRAEFMDMARVASTGKDLFVAVFPGDGGELERDYTFLGRLTQMPKLSSTPDDMQAGVYRTKLTIAEI